MSAAAGLLLCIGLWTPISGAVTAAIELWIAIGMRDAVAAHSMAVAIALALAVLGPGAWSLDARLFGRRRISLSDR
jgi:putative oxidoreductase